LSELIGRYRADLRPVGVGAADGAAFVGKEMILRGARIVQIEPAVDDLPVDGIDRDLLAEAGARRAVAAVGRSVFLRIGDEGVAVRRA
jgi:hypothetical protein